MNGDPIGESYAYARGWASGPSIDDQRQILSGAKALYLDQPSPNGRQQKPEDLISRRQLLESLPQDSSLSVATIAALAVSTADLINLLTPLTGQGIRIVEFGTGTSWAIDDARSALLLVSSHLREMRSQQTSAAVSKRKAQVDAGLLVPGPATKLRNTHLAQAARLWLAPDGGSTTQVAEAVGVAPRTVQRSMKATFGMSRQEVINRLRVREIDIERVIQALAAGRSVKELLT